MCDIMTTDFAFTDQKIVNVSKRHGFKAARKKRRQKYLCRCAQKAIVFEFFPFITILEAIEPKSHKCTQLIDAIQMFPPQTSQTQRVDLTPVTRKALIQIIHQSAGVDGRVKRQRSGAPRELLEDFNATAMKKTGSLGKRARAMESLLSPW
ncbi:hypothetical protein F2P81_001255 [Scophthalmus maximus]|uniref:Uncharacterized protein n=1 Tax=Scophthalmus maximus TaxID=52904 RepID=A0A6A4U000_SCOMX|nr:hypothetical protein F2P81_001255 [Scophthalmus maximus]